MVVDYGSRCILGYFTDTSYPINKGLFKILRMLFFDLIRNLMTFQNIEPFACIINYTKL